MCLQYSKDWFSLYDLNLLLGHRLTSYKADIYAVDLLPPNNQLIVNIFRPFSKFIIQITMIIISLYLLYSTLETISTALL